MRCATILSRRHTSQPRARPSLITCRKRIPTRLSIPQRCKPLILRNIFSTPLAIPIYGVQGIATGYITLETSLGNQHILGGLNERKNNCVALLDRICCRPHFCSCANGYSARPDSFSHTADGNPARVNSFSHTADGNSSGADSFSYAADRHPDDAEHNARQRDTVRSVDQRQRRHVVDYFYFPRQLLNHAQHLFQYLRNCDSGNELRNWHFELF